jgi:hypothetical protein
MENIGKSSIRATFFVSPRQTSSNLQLVTDSSVVSLVAGAIAGLYD